MTAEMAFARCGAIVAFQQGGGHTDVHFPNVLVRIADMTGNSTLRPWLRFQFSKVLQWCGARQLAIEQLEDAVKEDPQAQQAWRYLAFLLCQRGDRARASEAFEAAIRLDPADADTRFNFGFLLQSCGSREQAAEQFQEVIRLKPALDRAWYGLGLIRLEQQEFKAAAEHLAEAARLQYFNPYAGYYLAAAYCRLGERDRARAEYERVKSYDPKMGAQMEADFGLP